MATLLKGLFNISVTASFMILVVIGMRKGLSRRMNPAIMLFLWGMILVRLCFPFTFASPVHLTDLMPRVSTIEGTRDEPQSGYEQLQKPPAQEMKKVGDESQNHQGKKPEVPSTPLVKAEPQVNEMNNRVAKSNISIWSVIAVVWAMGSVSILLTAIRDAVLFKRKLLLCKPGNHQITQIAAQHIGNVGIKRKVELLECNYVQSPVVFGYFKPNILLPTPFARDMDGDKLNSILLHEICHIKRHDILVNYIWLLAKAIHWFNPLVWVAYRLYQDDVELYCDQMVVNHLSEDGRQIYSQSLIEAVRFSRQKVNPIPSVVTSLYGNKSKLKERIVRLVKPQKKSKTLAGMSILLAMLMLIMGFTTACQKTPDNPTVIGKDGSKLEKIIKSSSGNKSGQTGDTQVTRYTDSFRGADKNVTVNIDADVVMPSGKIPVVKVEPYKIPMEQVKAMAEVLFQGNPAYETQIVMTKGELEEKILELKGEISNEEALLVRYNDDQEMVNKVKENYEQRITEYERLYTTAPETHTPKETDWTFHPGIYYRDKVEAEGELAMYGNLDQTNGENDDIGTAFQATSIIEGYRGAIQVSHGGGFVFGMGSQAYGDFGWWSSYDSKPMDISKEVAIAMVEDALLKMGITHMELFKCTAYGDPKLYSNNFSSEEDALKAAASGDRPTITEPVEGEDVYSYSMTFVPTYEGIAVHDMSPFQNGGSEHGVNHSYESISVNVSNGMITYLYWSDPMEQIEVENDDVATITFKEAAKIFKKQMGIEYTIGKLTRSDMEDSNFEDFADDEENRAYYEALKGAYEEYQEYLSQIESGEIHITDIELKLMRIRIQNRPGEYRMVPAWIFLGYEELHFKDGKSKIQEPEPGQLYPYAVINALDGSIINIAEGY